MTMDFTSSTGIGRTRRKLPKIDSRFHIFYRGRVSTGAFVPFQTISTTFVDFQTPVVFHTGRMFVVFVRVFLFFGFGRNVMVGSRWGLFLLEFLYTRLKNLKILTGTWNVGQGRAAPNSLVSWLGSVAVDIEIIVVGLQEVEMGPGFLAMSAAKETMGLEGSSAGQWWLDMIGKTLDEGSMFTRIGSRQLAGLLISVWVRNNIRGLVGDADVAPVPCGLGRAIGNKGAVGIRMRVYNWFEVCDRGCVKVNGKERKMNLDNRERHEDVMDIWRSLNELHLIYLDIAVMVEALVGTYVMGIGEAEVFSEWLKPELQALEAANVHAILENEPLINEVLQGLESATNCTTLILNAPFNMILIVACRCGESRCPKFCLCFGNAVAST